MTVRELLRGLEPFVFGATPESSWLLRDRIRAYSLLGAPAFPSPQTGSRAGAPSSALAYRLGPDGQEALLATPTRERSPW